MARIVLTTFGSYGDVNPYIGLALAFGSKGHEPVLALPAAYRKAVERENLAFSAVRPDIDIHNRELAARIMDPRNAHGRSRTWCERSLAPMVRCRRSTTCWVESVAGAGQAPAFSYGQYGRLCLRQRTMRSMTMPQ